MSDAITAFFSAWATADADAIGGAMADSFAYADPRSPEPITDLAALAEYVSAFSANAPGWSARVAKYDTVGAFARATVAFGGPGPDGAPITQHGQYFAQLDDTGRLSQLIGFVGTGAFE